jgi:hypothetical protein
MMAGWAVHEIVRGPDVASAIRDSHHLPPSLR